MSAQLFVGRLSKQTRQRDIQEIFRRYGPMVRCELKYGKCGQRHDRITDEGARAQVAAVRP